MLNEQAEVKVEKDDGLQKRWAQGVFYRREGNKLRIKSDLLKGLFIGSSAIVVIVFLFAPAPKTREQDTSIDTPSSISSYNEKIVVESYSDIKDNEKKKATKKQYKIEPLKIVSRTLESSIPLGLSATAKLLIGATNGPVKAKLLEDVELNGEIYIKEGSTLWGQGASTEQRLIVTFVKYVDSDGKSHKIKANAYDSSDQILGLKGSVIGRTSKKILAGAGLGVAGALQTMQQAENMGGVAVIKPNLKNALLNGASSATLGIAEQELEELKNKQTIIEVSRGTEIVVVFGEVQ
ncbi:MAG: TrbI/VirB10 family protein [Bdellovibrionota bacterium]|nr:TrbI/VirB10 family protein [Bdellovibrionota bacterium]